MEKIINALLKNIRSLGIDALLMPQKVSANRPRMELYFSKIEPAGIDRNNPELANKGWERITFNAEFRSEGTHSQWVADTIITLRRLLEFHEKNMCLKVTADKDYYFQAHWVRRSTGRFEYPDEEQSSMPVRYVEGWEISISYQANIIKEKI